MLSDSDPSGYLNKIRKSVLGNPFLCLGFFVVILGTLLSISSQDGYTEDSIGLSRETKGVQDLFLASAQLSWFDSPDFLLVGKMSIAPFSPPVMFTPQILSSLVGPPEVSNTDLKKNILEYVVKEGDTFSSIAEKYEINTTTILNANSLTKNSILKVGQKLVILPVSGVLHLVERGDTLSNISEDYGVKISEILSYNEIEDSNIYKGDLLIIPGGKKIERPSYYASTGASSYFIVPTKGYISQRTHFYNAIDIANKCGTPIYSVAGGKVYMVKYNSWPGGNYIKIEHYNGVITYYGHLSSIIVKPGQEVSQGQRIGYMGTTGLSTGCHLHFDVLSSGVTNPLAKYPLGTYVSW